MTQKEKAKELLDKMTDKYYNSESLKKINAKEAKRCALICVDEILEIMVFWGLTGDDYLRNKQKYWQEVKQEIEKL